VDAWSFDVGLSRVKAYYTARLNSTDEYNNATSIKEKAQVILQKRFYAYALEELESAYIYDDGENFDYYLPQFYKNMEEFRKTSLYSEAIYPITYSGEAKTMHAWDGCPNASGSSEVGSPSLLENEHFEMCDQCDFEFQSISNVASANTSISTGFEYHYAGFRQAVEDYKKAYDEAKPALDSAKNTVNSLLDSIKDVFANAQNARINVEPPGANGNITIAVNVGKASLDTGIEGIFLKGGTTLGTRAAVSAAGLASDTSSDGGTIITNLLDGFDLGVVGSGVESLVLGAWSSLLKAYSDGQSAVSSAMQSALSSMSTNTVSGLGNWASGVIGDVVDAAGLAPADVDVKKAVLVNTARVAAGDSNGFGVKFLEVKRKVLLSSTSSPDAFSVLLEVSGISGWFSTVEEKIQVAKIEFPIGGVELPITITLPDAVKESASGLLSQAQEAIKQNVGSVMGGTSWQ
jgi:tetratricopeptide (TPR) repeat protein